MNSIAKVLAPAALALASFSAGATGLIEIDYPLDQPRYGMAQEQAQGGTALEQNGAPRSVASGVLEIDYPTVQPQRSAMTGHTSPAKTGMQHQTIVPGQIDLGYFA